MREIISVVVGLLVAAFIPSAVLAIISPLFFDYSVTSIWYFFVIYYMYSLIFVVVFGLPAFLLLRPFRPARLWFVTAIGFGLGIMVPFALQGIGGQDIPLRDFLIAGVLGSGSAVAFWLIWLRFASL